MTSSKQINLEMIRGDTFSFDLILHDIDPASIESLYFTVKRRATDPDASAVLQKSLTDGIERVTGDDLRYRVRVAGWAAGRPLTRSLRSLVSRLQGRPRAASHAKGTVREPSLAC